MKIKKASIYFLLFSVSYYLTSCSNQATGPVALAYHNTTAHYNAYFLGRERMKELETGLYEGDKNNFNRILSIYPKVDCTFVKGNKDKLDKIIKNVSLVLQWHKPSHWMDDAYLVLGKVRYYDLDLDNAITTFRFINNRYKDDDVKHEALIWLMHTYLDQKEWQLARQMGEYLDTQPMLPKNTGKLSLVNGSYHILNQEYKQAYEKMKVGVKYVRPRPYRAKIHYIIGQLAEKEGMDKEAYANFKLCARSSNQSSGYEMWFNATLKMYLLNEFKSDKDIDKAFRFYRKMLRDIKNADYKDKIYYDMATIEQKRERLDDAIGYYKSSIKEAKKTKFVKAFSYLRIAEIYYDKRQDFENAKIYYDSTITVLDKDLPEYPKAFRRQKVLENFVKHIKIVRLEDSLQKLARMDTASLSKLLDTWIKKEMDKEISDEKEAKRKANSILSVSDTYNTFGGSNLVNDRGSTQTLGGLAEANAGTNEKWLFYNPEILEVSKVDFSKKWGNRPNEDDWRRMNKEKDQLAENSSQPDKAINASGAKDTSGGEKKVIKSADARKQKYLDNIPLTKVKMDTSMAKLSRSLFQLGKIYDFSLEEYPNSIKSYERFVNEFQENERRAEAMYAIYLICKNKLPKDDCSNKYGNMLISEYPTSIYAKLVLDPDYLQKNKILGEQIKVLYRQAFEAFERDQFLVAQNILDDALAKYPNNDFEDRLLVLKAMIIAKTQSIHNYQEALKIFIEKYKKTSKLIPFAANLLVMADSIAKKDAQGLIAKRVTWNLDINFTHYFAIVVKNKTILPSVIDRFKTYNNEFFTDEKLNVFQVPLDDTTTMVVVRDFPNSIPALNYFAKQNGKSSPLRTFPEMQFQYFVISDKNFTIMTEEKNYKSYLDFFSKNY